MPSSKTQTTRDRNLAKIFVALPLLVTSILAALRGVVVAIAFVPLAMALGADVSALRFRASRKVAFRSLSLLLIGGYLLAMAGESL